MGADRSPMTPPPAGPTMSFLSNASTPPTRRSPFAEFKGDSAPPTGKPHGASPGGRRRRSRSPHSAPDAAYTFDAASEGRVTAAIKHLQETIDGLEKQRADDRKWTVESARRIDAVEAQVREQTREAMEYAREKCNDIDGRLRALDVGLRTELDDKVPKLLTILEDKIVNTALRDLTAKSKEYSDDIVKALEAKTAEQVKVFEAVLKAHGDQVKQHEAYLQRLHDAKPEDTQTMAGCLKYLDEELNKMKVVMTDPVHKQKMLDEAKRMMQDVAHEIKTDYDGKIGQVAGTGFLQHGQTDERIKSIETEVIVMKIAAAGLQAPPGYAGADGGLQGSISMRAAYGGYSRHGGYGNGGTTTPEPVEPEPVETIIGSVEAAVTSVERLASRLSHAKAFLREEALPAPIFTFDAIAITWTSCWWTWGRLKTTSGGSGPFGRP